MENFKWYNLSLIGLLIVSLWACNIERVDDDLIPEDINLREEGCQLTISGNVVSTVDLKGLDEVMLSSSLFSDGIIIDENGEFTIKLSLPDDTNLDVIEIIASKEGYISNAFFFDLAEVLEMADCSLVTSIEWNIGLTPLQESFGIRTDRITNLTIIDTVAVATFEVDANGDLVETDTVQCITKYSLQIPKAVAGQSVLLSITPNNNFANGAGIVNDPNSAQTGEEGIELVNFHFESTEQIRLNGKIRIRFAPKLSLSSGDIVNLDSSGGYVVSFNSNTGVLTLLVEKLEDFSAYNSSASCALNNTMINSNTVVDTETFSNCDCGDSETFVHVITGNLGEQIDIQFPDDVDSDEQGLILRHLRNKLNIGGAGIDMNGANNVSVLVDKCRVVNLTTKSVVRTYVGSILGMPYTYTVTEETKTDTPAVECPIDSACHQGC